MTAFAIGAGLLMWFGASFILWVAYTAYRDRCDRKALTRHWLEDIERRSWSVGIEQSSIRVWPIQKDEDA